MTRRRTGSGESARDGEAELYQRLTGSSFLHFRSSMLFSFLAYLMTAGFVVVYLGFTQGENYDQAEHRGPDPGLGDCRRGVRGNCGHVLVDAAVPAPRAPLVRSGRGRRSHHNAALRLGGKTQRHRARWADRGELRVGRAALPAGRLCYSVLGIDRRPNRLQW